MAIIFYCRSGCSDFESAESAWNWQARALRDNILDRVANERHSHFCLHRHLWWSLRRNFQQSQYAVVEIISKIAADLGASSVGSRYDLLIDISHLL